jgi:hypothetical protein
VNNTKKEMMDFTKILSASITLHSKNLKLETNLRQSEKIIDLLKKIGERNQDPSKDCLVRADLLIE